MAGSISKVSCDQIQLFHGKPNRPYKIHKMTYFYRLSLTHFFISLCSFLGFGHHTCRNESRGDPAMEASTRELKMWTASTHRMLVFQLFELTLDVSFAPSTFHPGAALAVQMCQRFFLNFHLCHTISVISQWKQHRGPLALSLSDLESQCLCSLHLADLFQIHQESFKPPWRLWMQPHQPH